MVMIRDGAEGRVRGGGVGVSYVLQEKKGGGAQSKRACLCAVHAEI